jgi:predicted nucleic acid-binding protein
LITAVDTSVLLDVFGADPVFGNASKQALKTCLQEGSLVACEVVWAEAASFFPDLPAAQDALTKLAIGFSSVHLEAALTAAKAWRDYRNRGGVRTRVIADFLIGAHARHQAERLLTRDRGFYRSYFRNLAVLDPAT